MSTAVETEPLKMVRLEVHNFLRVEALTVNADGRHVVITGANGSGKTSAVDAIWAALGGREGNQAPEPIHRGAGKASVRLDLGEYIVTRHWTAKATRLEVTAADGSEIRQPQKLLDGLLGKYSLDPVAFLERRARDQLDDVLGICGVNPPVFDVQKITGEAQAARTGESASAYLERLSADETGLYYVRRRDARRDLDQKEHALAEQREQFELIGGPLRDDEETQSPAELLGRLKKLDQLADERRAIQKDAEDRAREWETGNNRLAQRLVERDDAAALVEQRRKQLAEAEETLRGLDKRIANGREIVAELEAEATASRKTLELFPDPRAERENLHRKMKEAEAANTRITKRRLFQEQLNNTAQGAEEARSQHEHFDQVLGKLRELRANLLNDVDLGVPGLAVGDGELRLDSVPFRQASLAQRISVACAVAMRQKPRLRLLRIDNSEHLDSDSRSLVLSMADKFGWQVIMTAVRDGDGLRVEIVEGEAS